VKKQTSEDKIYYTVKDLCVIFNRADRTIRQWIKDGQISKVKKGNTVLYNLPELIKYYAENIYQKEIDKDLETLKKEQLRVKIEKEEFELQVKKGKYIEKEKMELEWSRRAAEYKQSLIALEFRLSGLLANKKLSLAKVREIIKKEVLQILNSLIRDGEYTPVINENLPIETQEEAYRKFWEKLKKIKKKVKKIDVEINTK
jgi:hypothetical protein